MRSEICNGSLPDRKLDELFIQAVRNGKIDQIEWCIKEGADIHYQDDMALDTASTFGNFESLKYLIGTVGYDVSKNFRCLRDAAQNNNLDMLRYLVEECGADVKINDNLILCAINKDSNEAMLYLMEHGATLEQFVTEKPAIISKGNIAYLQNKPAQNAWMFSSVSCMKEILPLYKNVFFSDDNIKAEMTASDIVSKLEKNPSIVNYVLKELLHYQPEKLNLILDTRDQIQGVGTVSTSEQRKELFDKWLNWLNLDNKLQDKEENKSKMKI